MPIATPALDHFKSQTDQQTGNRKYPYPPTGEMFWSVTSVIGGTEDSGFFVGPWRQRMAAQVALDNAPYLVKLREEHGPVLKKDTKTGHWIGAVRAVRWVTKRVDELAEIKSEAGKHVHAIAEALVLWAASPGDTGPDMLIPDLPDHLVGAMYDEEPIQDVIDAMSDGFMNFVAKFRPVFTATEMTVYDPHLKLAGTLDCRIELHGLDVDDDGKLYVKPGHVLTITVDIKSGANLKWSWIEQGEKYRTMPLALATRGEIVEIEPTQTSAVLWLRPELPGGFDLRIPSKADRMKARNTFGHARHTFLGRQEEKNSRVGPSARWLTDAGTLSPVYLASLAGIVHGSTLNPLMTALGSDATVDDVARFTEKELLAIPRIGKGSIVKIAAMVAEHATPVLAEVA